MSDLRIHKETAEEIEERMVNKFTALGGQPLALSDERRYLLQAIAYGLFIRNETTNEGFKMNFVRHTKGEFADEIGVFTDTTRLPSSSASTTLRFEIEQAQGTVVGVTPTRATPGNDLYFITDYFEFAPGETVKDVVATCMETGEVGNGFLAGEINKIVDPFPLFKSVTNLEVSQGGADIETDASLKERIREAPSKFSTAGPTAAYIYWAKTANQSIIDVDVQMTVPGTVKVTPLMEDGELPADSVLSEVSTVLNDDRIRPLTDTLVIEKPTQINYNIDFTYYISKSNEDLVEEIQTKVQEALTNYIAWQKAVLRRDITPTELIYLIRSAGAKRVVVREPVFTTVDVFEVAKEVTVTPMYGGIEDD